MAIIFPAADKLVIIALKPKMQTKWELGRCRMRICQLDIQNFRGIRSGSIAFEDHTVLVGSNNSGKTTVIDALGLVLGRDRSSRALTEHDFYGSNPRASDRIMIVATVTGFAGNDPRRHAEWFREGRAVPKWWDGDTHEVKVERETGQPELCAQIGFAARFDMESLSVETMRYFHDDTAITDPFVLDVSIPLPRSVVADLGLFVVPVSRTWDRQLSFESQLFRRLISATSGLPSSELLAERDRLRTPVTPMEETSAFSVIVDRIDAELARVFPDNPKFKLRVTSTDSEALLSSLVPHYQVGSDLALPATRHGTGLVSVQTLLLLLEFGRIRHDLNENFILAIEEPEIHVPPGIQKRLVYRSHAVSDQTIVTSHSPSIVAFYPPTAVRLMRNLGGELSVAPLLPKPLDNSARNGIRRLYQDYRPELIEALMQEYVIIPEGRTDHWWFKLLVQVTETKEGWDASDDSPFGTRVGVVPTQEAAIVSTYQHLRPLAANLVILVDGDSDGDRYASDILRETDYPRLVIQWPKEWTIENVVAWILAVSPLAMERTAEVLGRNVGSMEELASLLLSRDVKQNYLLHEDIAQIIKSDETCLGRVKQVLADLQAIIAEPTSENANFEPDKSGCPTCPHRTWVAQ